MGYDDLDAAFSAYFGTSPDKPKSKPSENYTYQQHKEDGKKPVTSKDIPKSNVERYVAEGNVSTLDEFISLLEILLKSAWGPDWGILSEEFSPGTDPEKLVMPQITYDLVSREANKQNPLGPKLMNTVYEIVDEEYTGDAIEVYSQLFDLLVEFNIWGGTKVEANKTLKKFERTMSLYGGLLKKKGVSRIMFLREISSKDSVNYLEDYPMKAIIYGITLENITEQRQSTYQKISVDVDNAFSSLVTE